MLNDIKKGDLTFIGTIPKQKCFGFLLCSIKLNILAIIEITLIKYS